MHVLAALGDAPTAAIAIVAILLGVFFAARGPREKRAADPADTAEDPRPTLLNVPITAPPEREPGFVGPQGEVVGHGPIRLGAGGALGAGEPAAVHPAAATPAAPEPPPDPEPAPEPAPAPAPPPPPEPVRYEAPAATSEQPLFMSPPTLPEPTAETPPDAAAEPPPAAEDAPPDAPKEPAWRVAARAANSAVHFRQGTIKLGGKPAKKDD